MIVYRNGYIYQLRITYTIPTTITPPSPITTPFIGLGVGGELTIRAGYAWDGPSGPTIDTPNFMRGSLVHDALYQLMREGWLGVEWREEADMVLWRVCREDGMGRLRAWWVYWGVRLGGGTAADKRYDRQDKVAGRDGGCGCGCSGCVGGE